MSSRIVLYLKFCICFQPIISITEIVECLAGAEVHSSSSSTYSESSTADQSLLLTLVAKIAHAQQGSGASRILAIKFGSRDLRNAMLSGLR